MYEANTIGRRRPRGWTDRRQYFRRLLEMASAKLGTVAPGLIQLQPARVEDRASASVGPKRT
jgi:hypothetical protein